VFPGHERQCGFECRAVSVSYLKAIRGEALFSLVSRHFPEFPPKRGGRISSIPAEVIDIGKTDRDYRDSAETLKARSRNVPREREEKERERSGRSRRFEVQPLAPSGKRTMKFSLAVALAVASLFLLSVALAEERNRPRVPRDVPAEKRFLEFKSYRRSPPISAGAIINVPIQCPPETMQIGNHCRYVY